MKPVENLDVAGRHLEDDVLVRRIDDELDSSELDRVEEHLAACEQCRAALADLTRLSTRFSASLPLADHELAPAAVRVPVTAPAPLRGSRSWTASPLWRAAAAIALLAGLALAIAPVRAWMAERLGLATRTAEQMSPGVVESGGASPDPDDGLRIAFVPEGDLFVVRVSQPQSTGTLTLAAAEGDSASAEISGGGSSADLLVLPDGLGIRNDASAATDYRVTVPRGLTRAEVRIADRVVWSGSPALLDGPRSIPMD